MTVTHPYTSCHFEPTARRRTGMLAFATALALALGLGLGVPASRADVGGVYFDASNNAAAGDTNLLFNATFTGVDNVGLGPAVMPSLTTGDFNLANGTDALNSNTTGTSNVATGNAALNSNTTGDNNVATGADALGNNTTGSGNVALGFQAGLGNFAGSDNVYIANNGPDGDESATIRIGDPANQSAAYIAGIHGTTPAGSTEPVVIDASGQLGTAPELSDSVSSLATKVQSLTKKLKRQQRQINRLRRHLKGG